MPNNTQHIESFEDFCGHFGIPVGFDDFGDEVATLTEVYEQHITRHNTSNDSIRFSADDDDEPYDTDCGGGFI